MSCIMCKNDSKSKKRGVHVCLLCMEKCDLHVLTDAVRGALESRAVARERVLAALTCGAELMRNSGEDYAKDVPGHPGVKRVDLNMHFIIINGDTSISDVVDFMDEIVELTQHNNKREETEA